MRIICPVYASGRSSEKPYKDYWIDLDLLCRVCFCWRNLRYQNRSFLLSGTKIEIDLDGVYGYPTSFLEEAFGGLARKHSVQDVLDAFSFISQEQPGIVDEIMADIINANAQ